MEGIRLVFTFKINGNKNFWLERCAAAFDRIKHFEKHFHFELWWLCKNITVFMPQNLNLRSVIALIEFSTKSLSPTIYYLIFYLNICLFFFISAKLSCSPNRFQCSNHICIYPSLVCDGHDNCGDNSDEDCKLFKDCL